MSDFARLSDISRMYGWHVYVVQEEGDQYSKIGTAQNPRYRLGGLRGGNPRQLEMVAVWHVSSRQDALRVELQALANIGASRLHGRDWLNASAEEAMAAVRAAFDQLKIEARKL